MKAVVYSKNGTAKYEARNIEYHDSWMGEEYVTFSLESPYPINIEIGDYLVYRGHTYSAYNVPSALKQARRDSYGAAFKYDNVKFSSRSAEMADTDMHDIVLYDNNIHYTSLPKFSVYCETFDDLLDRLQANMNRNGGWQWIFLSPYFDRVSQRYPLDNPLRAEAISLWEEYYGSDHDHPTADTSKEKRGVNISFDNNSVWDAVGKVHEVFGVNYLVYDRVVVVGAGGVPADKIFRYGKGNGLATIERIADNDQKVVTRLFAYGSNKNLPLRYYSDLAWKPFMTVTYKEDMSEYDDPIYFRVQLDMPWAIGTYKEPHPSWHNATLQQDLIGGWAPVVVSLDMKTPIAYTNPYSGERNSILTCDMVEHNLYQQFVKGQARLNGLPMELYDTIEVGTRIYFLDGVYRESFNDQHRGYDLAELPNNMAVDFLMLPGFPKYSLNELCRCVEENGKTLYQIRKDTDTQNYSTFLEVDGSYPITFSTDKLKPYIQSQNAATLGIKEGNIFFDEENDDNGLKEVYPSIEEMTVGDVFGTQSTERLDELADAQIVEDNGVFEEGKEVSNVWVALKDLGFNLQWAINNSTGDAQISFKDGYCSGRTFSIKGVSQNEDGTWKVSLQREVDNSVHLYFPYSSAAARGGEPSSDEAYQLQAGDHFVLTGISLSDTSYVWAASVRALRKAIVWLLANDYTRFTYRPTVDEIFMQRQHDAATSGEETIEYGSVSLHDTLKAGMLMLFEDADLDVDGSLFIDSLTIKEDGNNGIPTYDVVLREEKQVGTLQKMQNEVNSVSSSLMSGAGGLSIPQVEGLIKTYGKEWFLSRVADDVAQGFIGFVKGLWVKTRGLFGIDENGNAKVHSLTVNEDYSIDENGDAILRNVNANNIVTKTLTAQDAHFFNLIIDEAKSVGGQIVVSPANAEIVHVVASDSWRPRPGAAPTSVYILYFKAQDEAGKAITNQFSYGDLVLHMEFNVAQAQTRNYWYPVVSGTYIEGIEPESIDLDGDGENETLCHYIVVSQTGKAGSEVPQAGDDVVCFGNTGDTSRQNAIVISAYNIPFIDSAAFMGDANGIQAPLFVEYSGVNGFNVTDGMRRNVIARNGTRIIGDQILMKTANQYVSGSTTTPIVTHKGEWVTGTTAKFYEEYTYGDCTWLCINANGTSNAPSINSADWKLTAGVTTYDIEITSWWMYHEEGNGDLFSLDCYFKVYKTLAGTRAECNPSEIVVRAGLDVPTIQPDYPAVLPYVNNHYAFLLEDYLISQFADLPSQFFIEVKDANGNPLAKYDTPVTIVYNGKDGTNGRDGQSYTMRGSAMKFYQDIDDFIEWVSDHAIQVADGDRVIIDDSDPSGTRGSEVYVYDRSYVDPITDRRYWKLEREAAIGDAYIIRFKDNDPDLQRPSWNFDGHVFVATEETLDWQEPNWQWWTDLGKIVGEDGADGADGKDGIAFYFDPAIVVLEEVLTIDPTTHAAHTTIASQEARLKFNRGGTEGYAILSTILTPPTGGFSASLSNNTLTISYNGTTGTATESSVIVQGSISANGQTIQVTQTLSLKINRLGQAQLSLMNGLASLLVGGTVYDSNGTARTFESGIQTSKTSGFIGTMVNGLAAAGIEFDATDVTNTILKLIADKVRIMLPDGQTQVALFSYENGQAVLNTDLIKAQEVVTNGLQANTIDADNATIENLNVTHAEIEESVFKGDIYTPPFVLDEDNIGERDEQGNYKYITNDSALGWVIDIKKTGKNLQINTNYCQDGAGSYIDLNYIGLYNPTVQTERDALIGAECNIVYTPRLDADIHLNAYVYNNGGVKGTSQYLIWTPALHPMSFIKCKYTKFYDFNSAHTEKYGWVVIDYHNVSTGIFPISGTSLGFSRGLSFGGIRTVLQDYTLTKDDFFILVSGTSNITLTLPTYPNMYAGQTYMIRLIVNRTVYLKSSSSNISYNGVNLSNTYNTSRGSIIFVTYVGGIWQVAHMTNG